MIALTIVPNNGTSPTGSGRHSYGFALAKFPCGAQVSTRECRACTGRSDENVVCSRSQVDGGSVVSDMMVKANRAEQLE